MLIPAKLEEQLKAGMREAGIPIPDTPERWEQAMTALKACPHPLSALQLEAHICQLVDFTASASF